MVTVVSHCPCNDAALAVTVSRIPNYDTATGSADLRELPAS